LGSIGGGPAVFVKGDVVRCPEVDGAGLVHDRAVGADDPPVLDETAVDADPARLRDDPAEVQDLVPGGADDDGDLGRRAFHEADLLPGGQENVAVRGVDDAAVGNIGGNQVDAAARGGTDRPLVFDPAGQRAAAEVDFPGLEVAVRDVEGGGDKAVDVDRGGGADEDAVLVNQIDPAVGLQGAVDGAGVVAADPVQDGARGGGLDEAGELAVADGEVLPVDDRPVGVGDGEDFSLGGEARLAAHDLRAKRIGNRQLRDQDPQDHCCAESPPQTLQYPDLMDRFHGLKPPACRLSCCRCYPVLF